MELDRLATDEPPSAVWEQPPRHIGRYKSLVGDRIRSGPAFTFPDSLKGDPLRDVGSVTNESELNLHFTGWVAGEIKAGRNPVVGVREHGHVVSVCFCARRSALAAEAGVETAALFRCRGFAALAVTAWAHRVRARGLTPLYSTDWENRRSLEVARKLALVPFAADFSFES